MKRSKYWKTAGNAEYGLKALFQDIQEGIKPSRRQSPPPQNNNYTPAPQPQYTEEPRPIQPPRQYYQPAPSYAPQPTYKSYRSFTFGQTIFLILFMTALAVGVYYLITDPQVLVNLGHRIINWFQAF